MLAALVWFALASLAHAQPSVRVRAEARIELRIDRSPGRVTVGGTLRDDLGEPLPGRRVEVRVVTPSGETRARAVARTDATGSLGADFALDTGAYRVIARWEGDEGHQRVEVAQAVDLSRAHVRLAIAMGDGGRLDLDVPQHLVSVRASSEEGGAGLRVEVRDELDRRLAVGTTDDEGRVRFTIPSSTLGSPAAGRFVVSTPGDSERAPAQTEVPVVRFRPTRLSLRAGTSRLEPGRPVAVEGRLQDSQGPLPRHAIGIFRGDTHIATMLTDDDGRFARDLALETDDDRSFALQARYDSDAPWRPSTRSERIRIAPPEVGSAAWPWLLASMLACAIALALLSRRPRARRLPVSAPAPRPAPPGVAPARSHPLAAPQRDVGGTVLDADEGHAIAGVRIRVNLGHDSLEVETDAGGRFSFTRIDGDDALLSIAAEGYEGSEAAIRLPHRGQWSDMTVRLRSLRQAALIRYRPVAEALAPQHRWWAFWTPRELLDHASGPARAEVRPLTRAVERAAYGKAPPTEAEVEEIAERADRASRAIDVS